MQVRIQHPVLNGIFQHAKYDFPNECCGFLYGSEHGERLIKHHTPVHNVKIGDKQRRFLIDPLDYIKAEKFALEQGIDLLGIYHSHPLHPAIASEHDLAQAVPYFSYVIVSVFPETVREIRSWRLSEESHDFLEETIFH